MKNGMAISAICRQLKLVCDRIDNMSMDIEQFEQNNSDMVEVYASLRLDELEHAQMLTLNLTRLMTQSEVEKPDVNTDEGGSVFAAGELNSDTVEISAQADAGCGAISNAARKEAPEGGGRYDPKVSKCDSSGQPAAEPDSFHK